MISLNSKSRSCKNLIHATIHQPLQVRTNKHRCFVFCIGHTSLTCVPGIGKKNKYLLNRSGIHNLSSLYSKYRSINNMQQFKQWLQNDIGFTSYQANMTTCGIGSKLGEIKEINTGLTPICCPSHERREGNIKKRNRSIKSIDEKSKEEGIKKRKVERIKSENLLSVLSQEPKEDSRQLPDNYLTGVKSPDDQRLALRPPSMKTKDESDTPSNFDKLSSDQKHETNEILETKPMKSDLSLLINKNTDLLESTRDTNPSLKKNIISNIQTTLPATDLFKSEKQRSASNFDNSSDQKNKSKENLLSLLAHFTDKKEELPSMNIDNVTTHKSPIEKRQSTLDAVQDKKDELLSASEYSPNSSIRNIFPRKSILRNAQSKPISLLNADAFLSAIKQQQYTENKPFKIIQSPETDWTRTAINYGIDSGLHSKLNEISPDKIDDKSISAIRRSYASLPISTPAVFPTKPKSMKKSDTSNTDQQISVDPKFNASNITSPSNNNPLTKEENHKQYEERTSAHINDTNTQRKTSSLFAKYVTDKPVTITTTLNPPSPILKDKSQEYIFNRSDSPSNESQRKKVPEEISKTITEILEKAGDIVHEDLQASQINPILSTKSSPKQDDDHRRRVSKSSLLAEGLAQVKEKELAATTNSSRNDVQPRRSSEQKSSEQKKFFPLISDRIKQSIVNTSSPNMINQFKNDKTDINKNPYGNLTPTQVHQESNNLSSITHSSNTGFQSIYGDKLDEISSSFVTNSLINKTQSNLSNPVVKDSSSISSTTDHNPRHSLQTMQNFPLKEVANDYGSNIENKSDKELSTTDKQLNKERLQPEPIAVTSKFATPADISLMINGSDDNLLANHDSLSIFALQENNSLTKLMPTNLKQQTTWSKEKKSLSTLSSLSDSKQSINEINSSIDKTQSDPNKSISPSATEDLHKKANLITDLVVNKSPHSSTSSMISFPTKLDARLISSKHNIIDNEIINKKLSETFNLKEKFESKQQISSPSSPMPCSALWDNISNEKILSQRKNKSKQKVNPNDHNQNYHSSTTLFTFITRQQYLKERQALNEHILYIKRTKPS